MDEEHDTISGISINYASLAHDRWAGQRHSPDKNMDSESQSHDSEMLSLGRRFSDVRVLNQCDGCAVSTQRLLKSSGIWRLVVFPGDFVNNELQKVKFQALCASPALKKLASMTKLVEILTIHTSQRGLVDLTKLPPALVLFTVEEGYKYDRVFVDEECQHYGHGQAYKKLFGLRDQNIPKDWIPRLALMRPDTHVAFMRAFEEVERVLSLLSGVFD